LKIRKSTIVDVRQMQKLINEFAKREEMLPRSLNELYENIRDFYVCENRGEIIGLCALHILWEDLAEIRSLAVKGEFQKKGIGRRLLRRCLDEARRLGIKRVFALTYHPEFFEKSGFRRAEKTELPQKIWGDCLKCPKFPECDEDAVIIDLDNK
jgi:amino-acid N-acetyltransferase